MSDLTRRDFLKKIALKSEIAPRGDDTAELVLGTVARFPVHSKIIFSFENQEYFLESLYEGIRLKNTSANINIKISIGQDGLLRAHLKEVWPDSSVLSIFTGEIYNI